MVVIPPGRFLMGSAQGEGNDDERPQHEVIIPQAFAMGRYPVTFADYDVFARESSRALPDDEGWGRDKRPVINVSWEDAAAYCQWLSRANRPRLSLAERGTVGICGAGRNHQPLLVGRQSG